MTKTVRGALVKTQKIFNRIDFTVSFEKVP